MKGSCISMFRFCYQRSQGPQCWRRWYDRVVGCSLWQFYISSATTFSFRRCYTFWEIIPSFYNNIIKYHSCNMPSYTALLVISDE